MLPVDGYVHMVIREGIFEVLYSRDSALDLPFLIDPFHACPGRFIILFFLVFIEQLKSNGDRRDIFTNNARELNGEG